MKGKTIEPFIKFLKVKVCEDYKHLRFFSFIFLFCIFIIYK